MNKKYTETSKFLSYILRHQPESVGLSLNKEGWAVISDLILLSAKEGYEINYDFLQSIVENSDKKRFIISEDGLRIRASQGHSTQDVSIQYSEKTPPEILYHGTAIRFISSIREQGLIPKERQYVHLSEDKGTGYQVGQRYGKPIILIIKTMEMHEQGFKFYQAENGVWLTDSVPFKFIQV
ncbi:RNA 2'-phosphotransferase [Rosenbergiella australiborealis]|uniref:Probable RNA 2'-phosphotransferase n=1 Tax=Rosenbergiella australiborealis TaxID=1544696 RepID=A0ABS5T868_9GAMM|nr:RNA 2'-phosphotransferase [Rosenbergiella australiborealis]MBT0728540.1 RNA 2'-phosphotransferase [Rosenbergiella australiborealis]